MNELTLTERYLAHHGILGQKWGDRNGPPYPLGSSDHSASEKKAGWKKSLENESRREREVRRATQNADNLLIERDKFRLKKELAFENKKDKIQNKIDSNPDNLSKKHEKLIKKLDKTSVKQEKWLKDFDDGTRLIEYGEKKYIDTINNYRDAKLSALENKAYKKDPTYKKAVKDYVNQRINDTSYMIYYLTSPSTAQTLTVLTYASQKAQADRKANKIAEKMQKKIGVSNK